MSADEREQAIRTALASGLIRNAEIAYLLDLLAAAREREKGLRELVAEGDKLLWRYSIGSDDHTPSRRTPLVEQFRRKVRAALDREDGDGR